jgi:protein-S-isoprenylcysteine O-methyltransferase Ste14
MDETVDTAQVSIRPPLAWGLAVIVGLALNWLMPMPFLPADLPAGLLGAMVFVFSLALFAWTIVAITRAGSNVPTNLPTTTVVESGPYRFTRNPVYLGMHLGLIGLAIAFDSLWLLVMLVPFALRHPLRRSGPRGSLSGAQVRRCLPWLPLARAALAVALP